MSGTDFPASAPSAASDRLGSSESGLIKLAATQPELEYLFRHVLVQDAAYDTLLKQERRRLHVTVAATLQALYPERLDELAAMLAWHYQEADEAARTLPWLIRAGHHALRRYANTEAYSFFERAEGLAPPGDDPAILEASTRLRVRAKSKPAGCSGRRTSSGTPPWRQSPPSPRRWAISPSSGRSALWTAIMQWTLGSAYEEGTPFKRSLDRALELARQTDDRQLRGAALTILGRSSLMSTDPRGSARALEEAIGLTEGNDFIGTSLTADSLAMAYSSLGEWDKADAAVQRAHELAVRSGDPTAAVDADLGKSNVEIERGNFAAANHAGPWRGRPGGRPRLRGLFDVRQLPDRRGRAGQRPSRTCHRTPPAESGHGPIAQDRDLARYHAGVPEREHVRTRRHSGAAKEGWDRSLRRPGMNHDTGAEGLIPVPARQGACRDPRPGLAGNHVRSRGEHRALPASRGSAARSGRARGSGRDPGSDFAARRRRPLPALRGPAAWGDGHRAHRVRGHGGGGDRLRSSGARYRAIQFGRGRPGSAISSGTDEFHRSPALYGRPLNRNAGARP